MDTVDSGLRTGHCSDAKLEILLVSRSMEILNNKGRNLIVKNSTRQIVGAAAFLILVGCGDIETPETDVYVVDGVEMRDVTASYHSSDENSYDESLAEDFDLVPHSVHHYIQSGFCFQGISNACGRIFGHWNGGFRHWCSWDNHLGAYLTKIHCY